jgi:hypothetical protein
MAKDITFEEFERQIRPRLKTNDGEVPVPEQQRILEEIYFRTQQVGQEVERKKSQKDHYEVSRRQAEFYSGMFERLQTAYNELVAASKDLKKEFNIKVKKDPKTGEFYVRRGDRGSMQDEWAVELTKVTESLSNVMAFMPTIERYHVSDIPLKKRTKAQERLLKGADSSIQDESPTALPDESQVPGKPRTKPQELDHRLLDWIDRILEDYIDEPITRRRIIKPIMDATSYSIADGSIKKAIDRLRARPDYQALKAEFDKMFTD